MRIFFISVFVLLFLIPVDSFAQRKRKQPQETTVPTPVISSINLELEKSHVFQKCFSGFALYDPELRKTIYEYQSDKYFTPASNTKILTLYAGLQMLGDSIPTFLHDQEGSLNIIWGTGDPGFLNPHLEQNPAVYDYLKNIEGDLLFCGSNFKDKRYGSGWMWSDFPYAYQAEKSPFPVYGNVAHFHQNDTTNGIVVMPKILREHLKYGQVFDPEDHIGRDEVENEFVFSDLAAGGDHFDYHVPFHYTPEFLAGLLSDTLGREVGVLNLNKKASRDAKVIYGLSADSLYTRMMRESDNHIAEQILLLCSEWRLGHMNTDELINYTKKTFLYDLPDPPKWIDGSGLSRYNLITPRSQVKVLEKLYVKLPRERLFHIFPAGGVSGTIEDWYKNGNQPYVFAKTGTLRNNHCLSGYILTKSERVLIFSFMHNNYTISSRRIKQEMERYLRRIYEKL